MDRVRQIFESENPESGVRELLEDIAKRTAILLEANCPKHIVTKLKGALLEEIRKV